MPDTDTSDRVVLALAGNPPGSSDTPLTVVELGECLEMGAETMADRISLLSALSDLEDAGLVQRQSDDSGAKYTLTDVGFDRARAQYEEVADRKITVTNGTSMTISLRDVDDFLDEPAVVRALARLTDDDVLYLEESVQKDFVDRETELEALCERYDAARSGSGGGLVVTGEAGIGKTTLVEEAIDRFDDALVCSGVAQATTDRPYQVVRDAIESRLSTSPFDRPDLDLDSPEDLDNLRTSLFADVADALFDLAADRDGPVVLCLDELNNAERATFDLVSYLVRRAENGPLLLIAISRLEGVDDDHPIHDLVSRWHAADAADHLALASFGREHTREQIAATLGTRRLPEAFVDLVAEQTGGTPLFVAETLSQLQERNALAPEYGVFPTDQAEIPLPESVEETITSRLEGLDETGEAVLGLAALMDVEISPQRLRAATEPMDIDGGKVGEYLDLLVDVGVLDWVTDSRLRFHSGLFRETVVDRLPADRRREFHRRIARTLVETAGEDPGEAATIASHYEQAGETERALRAWLDAAAEAESVYANESALEAYERALALAREADRNHDSDFDGAAESGHDSDSDRDRENEVGIPGILESLGDAATLLGEQERAQRAFEYVRNEAEEASRRHRAIWKIADVYEATAAYEKARETINDGFLAVPAESRATCRLLGIHSRVDIEQGDFESAHEFAHRQRELATSLGEREFEAEALQRLGMIARHRSEFDRARQYLEEALAIARELDDRERQARILKDSGIVLWRQEETDRASEYFERGLEIAQELGIRQIEGDCLGNLGLVAYFEGEYDRARQYLEENRQIKADIGDRDGVATTYSNLGVMAGEQGNFDEARQYYQQSLEGNRDLGDRHGEAISLKNLGIVAESQGRYDEALEYLEASRAVDEDIGNRWGVAGVLNVIGSVYRYRGEFDRAIDYHERARAIGEEIDDPRTECESLGYLGAVARRRGEFQTARTYFDASLDIAVDLGRHDDELASLRGLGSIARHEGDLEAASQYFDEALTVFEKRNNRLESSRTRLERGRLAQTRGDIEAAREQVERATATFREIGAAHWAARGELFLGQLESEAGAEARSESSTSARELGRRALQTFEAVGAPQDALSALAHLVETCRGDGDDESAREWCRRAQEILAEAPPATASLHEEWVERHASDLGVS